MVERPNNDPDFRHLKAFMIGEIKMLFNRIEEVNARVTQAGVVCKGLQERLEKLEQAAAAVPNGIDRSV